MGLWGEVEDGGSCVACRCYSVGLKGGIRAVGGGSSVGQEGGWGVEGGLWGGWGGICGAGSGLWGEVEDGGSCGACGCYSVGLKIGIRTVGGASVGQEGGWGGNLWGRIRAVG